MKISLLLILFIISPLFGNGSTTQQNAEKAEMVSLLYYNPQATVNDFINQGLYGNVIYIYPESAYYRLKVIRTSPKFRNKNFQFDKNKFHLFYLKAKKIAAYLQNYNPYSKWDIFAPIEQRDYKPCY